MPLLRAEIYVNKGHPEQAEKMLLRWRDEKDNKKMPEFWLALASLAQQQGEWDKADRLLSEAQAIIGDTVTLRLARAQYLVQRYHGESEKRLRELAEKTEGFSEAERLQLWKGLIIWSLQANDDQQARRLTDRVADKVPGEVRGQLLRLRFELALRQGHESAGRRTGRDRESGRPQPGLVVRQGDGLDPSGREVGGEGEEPVVGRGAGLPGHGPRAVSHLVAALAGHRGDLPSCRATWRRP